MAENILILYPTSFNTTLADQNKLLTTLREEQFLGETIDFAGKQHYRPGEEFMMLITFLGCSPMIASGEMEKDGEQYCHIAIEGPLERPQFLAGDNIKIPRCPKCGHPYDKWKTVVDEWLEKPNSEIICPDCGETTSATKLRWRKSAGFGQFFIKMWGIFESEAVPSPNLLSLLKECSGFDWQHCYIRNN